MFIWINNGKYINYSYKQKVYTILLYLDNTDDTENDFENNNILRIFIIILDDFLDLIS